MMIVRNGPAFFYAFKVGQLVRSVGRGSYVNENLDLLQ